MPNLRPQYYLCRCQAQLCGPLQLYAHIFTRYKAGWYSVCDSLPQLPEGRAERGANQASKIVVWQITTSLYYGGFVDRIDRQRKTFTISKDSELAFAAAQQFIGKCLSKLVK